MIRTWQVLSNSDVDNDIAGCEANFGFSGGGISLAAVSEGTGNNAGP